MKGWNVHLFTGSLLVLLASCVSLTPLDNNFLQQNAKHSFDYSPEKCLKASVEVVEDLGGQIRNINKEKLTLVTNRFVVNEVVTVFDSRPYDAFGKVIREEHKIFLKVSAKDKGCEVSFQKYRVWSNGKHLEKVNADFLKKEVIDPFFKDIKISLEDMVFADGK